MGFLGSLSGSLGDNISSGLTGALFGGITAGRNWRYQKKAMALQQQYNERNMQLQYDYATKAWERENRYNNPSASAARWRLAGISPAAVYGNSPGGAGVAGSMSTPDSSNPAGSGNVDNSTYRPVSTVADFMRLENEKKVADSQADLNKALAGKARGDTKDPDITKRQQKLDFDWALVKKQREEIQKSIDEINSEYQRAVNEADLQIKQQILFETMAKIDKLLADKELSEEMKANLKEQRNLIKAQVDTEKSKQRNFDASTAKFEADTETENALRDGRVKIQSREAKALIYRLFGEAANTSKAFDDLARFLTNTDRSGTLWSFIDKRIDQLNKGDFFGNPSEAKAEIYNKLVGELNNYTD